jgi:thioredoxin reductase (NADPH)
MTDKILVYSTVWCPDCKRAKKFFGEHRIQYENVDIEQNPEHVDFVMKANHGMRVIPTIVFPDGTIMSEPSDAQLAEKLGLQTQASQKFYDVIVIGGGPAGLTAALYMAREGLETLVIEKSALGGQVGITQTLDNFPGFDMGVVGADLAERLGRQAKKFGVEILQAQEVKNVKKDERYFCVTTGDGSEYGAKAVLLATGARYRRLLIPGEDELIGINVHFCATCDGAFYKGKQVLVVGGGNSGFEEALFLTRFASQVDIVTHSEVRASQILQQKVAEQKNMTVTTHHAIQELRGEKQLEAIVVKDLKTGETKEWKYDGLFVFIGLTPNSDLGKNLAEADKFGFLITDHGHMTSLPGLFSAGDVRAGSTKQAATAAGEGASAAIAIREYLKEAG